MGTADERESPGTPLIVLRVVIRSPDVDTFVAKYSRFLKDDRIFIFTKASQPEGTRVRFTLELADGPIVMTGEGTVTRIRPDTGDPSKPPGMELRFLPLDEPSERMVARLLAVRSGAMTPSPRPVEPSQPVLPIHPLIDDLSTKIRTTTPSEPPKTEETGAGAEPESTESTDVDAQSRRKRFESLPPAFTTSPTPLPAPLPLPALLTPPHGAPVISDRLTRPNLPALNPTPALGVDAISELTGEKPARNEEPAASVKPAESIEEAAGGLPIVEKPPRVSESWCGPLPPPPGAPAPPPSGEGLVPANPFGDISDGAIEYFIEWSLEQSTAARPKNRPPQSASFANVPMAPPRAEPNRERSARRVRLLVGLLVGLALGLPLGAAGMWAWRPLLAQTSAGPFSALARTRPRPKPAKRALSATTKKRAPAIPSSAAAAPPSATPSPSAIPAAPSTTPKPAEPILTAHAASAEAQPSAPPAAAELPAPPPVAPHRNGRIGTFHIESKPPGAEVTVKGEPRGPAPVDVELPPNHRYEIMVEWPNGAKPWRHRVNLKPPLTQVTAVLR